MDCFDLPALGSESSDLPDEIIQNGSNQNSCNTIGDEDKSNQRDVEMEPEVVDPDKLKRETKEKILNSYKEGLKLFGLGSLIEAEEIFQSILDDPFLQLVQTTDEETQELNILKYVLYKNLSTINSKKNSNYSKALDFLIEAVKIDDTDRCVWYEIGKNALHLGKFLIARYSFEKSLSIDPHDWFSLDNLIVLLFAFGHYSLCLNYIFDSVKTDKFYVNGLILLKKLEIMDMSYYTKQIEAFKETFLNPYGIDIDHCLSRIDEEVYDNLMRRIDTIKLKHRDQMVLIVDNLSCNEAVKDIKVLEKINSWESLGEFVLKIDQSLDVSIKHSLKLLFESDASQPSVIGVESVLEKEKELEKIKELPNKKSKRKIKFDDVAGDDFSKRRSSRKFDKPEAHDDEDASISEIIKEYFDENYLNSIENDQISKLADKKTPKVLLTSVKQIEGAELADICRSLGQDHTNMFDIMRSFLKGVSFNYDKLWYGSVEELYVNIFNSLNRQFNLFEALEQETDPTEFATIVSMVLTYLEIEASKVKDVQDSLKKSAKLNKKADKSKTTSSIGKIIFNLQDVEFWAEKSSLLGQIKEEKLSRNTLLARVYSLFLYASIEFPEMSISNEYYEQKLQELFKDCPENHQIIVANSKVFQVISKPEIEEYLKQTKKNSKLKLNDQIKQMFNEAKYHEVVGEFADFPEIHNLQLEDPNVSLDIYLYLLNSYLILKQPDKSDYFSRFYLKQIIKFIQRSYLNKNTPPTTSDSATTVVSESSSDITIDLTIPAEEVKPERIKALTEYVIQILDVLEKSIDSNYLANQFSVNADSNQSSDSISATIKHDLVWIMSSLISIYYENNQLIAKARLDARPIKAFFILYSLLPNDLENKMAFLSSVHDYLAQSHLCNSNSGQFLSWTIKLLVEYKSQCELCSQPNNSESNQVSSQADDLTFDKQNKPRCSICGEMDKLLDQSFFCLYGYKKRTLRYLENHVVTRLPYTLESCVSLYNYYKPSKLPEYDDLIKMSIPTEFYDLLCEVQKLIQQESGKASDALVTLKNRFLAKLNKENFQSFDALLESISDNETIETSTFKDMYFLMGDYNFKTPNNNNENKDELVMNYLIKDLTINKNRTDAWTELALSTSAKILEDFPESGKNINSKDELIELLNSIYVCINLFTKSVENISSSSGFTSVIEFALFLYQMHSYCSRQVKLNEIIHHFESPEIKEKLSSKKVEFLRRSLELYKKADELAVKPTPHLEEKKLETVQEDSSSTSSSDKSTQETKQSSKSKLKASHQDDDEDQNEEEWLYHYMFGKIKEKLGYNLMECLQDYKISSNLLERNKPTILKKCTYKSRSCWYVELNEVHYRIYALTLKRIEDIMHDTDQMRLLSSFLEALTESSFVSAHGDLKLEETTNMMQQFLFDHSQLIETIPNKDLFINCVCICVAGLNQILRRFPQHYRSLYRLAHFYSNCLDFKSLEISKNILLSTSNWQNLPYMPSPGLFAERNKTNFFNGIWRISTNTKDEQQDLERKGNFSSHLFQALKLTLLVLKATKDTSSLIEISKAFYQKIDPDKQEKVYMDESYRAIVANMSLNCAYELSKETFTNRNWFTTNSEEQAANFADLVNLIMEAFEVQKLTAKYLDSIVNDANQLLIDICALVQTDALNRVSSIDQAIKFCQTLEKQFKQKPSKGKV